MLARHSSLMLLIAEAEKLEEFLGDHFTLRVDTPCTYIS